MIKGKHNPLVKLMENNKALALYMDKMYYIKKPGLFKNYRFKLSREVLSDNERKNFRVYFRVNKS